MRPTAPSRRLRPWEPAAYDYRAERHCAHCVIERLLDRRELRDVSLSLDEEVCLDRLAAALDVDRYAEDSYDSEHFPKVVLADQVDAGATCCICRRPLI